MTGIQRGRADGEYSAAGHFHAIADIAPVGIFHTDANGDVTYVNQEWCRLGGMTPEAAMGKGWVKAIHPEDRERVGTDWYEAAKTDQLFENEYRYVGSDGAVTWCSVRAKPKLDDSGNIIGYVGALTDINERKRAEEALRRSEELFRGIIENSPSAIILKDLEGRFQLVSSKFEEWFGIATSEVIGKMSHDVHREEDAEFYVALDKQVMATRSTQVLERNFLFPDGVLHSIIITKFPVRDETSRIIGIGTINTDITERKRAEETIRGGEKRFRELLESAPDAMVIVDQQGEIVLVNRQTEMIFGYAREELVGRPVETLIPHDLRVGHAETRAKFAANPQLRAMGETAELFGVARDGRKIPVEISLSPIRTEEGLLIAAAVRDVTETKRAEKALRESEERYRELFDESPIAIWVEDWSPIKQMLDDLARGGVEDWRDYLDSHRDQLKTAYDSAKALEISNASLELYRKESREEMMRLTAAAVVIDEELDAFREMLLSFLAGRMAVEIEAKDMAGDGSKIIVRRRVVIPPKYHDDWSRVIFAMEDISERTRLEEQLHQAQKMEAVGQLTGGIAHDFNNSLAIILGNADMLTDDLGAEDARVQAVLRAASRAADLTQRLLAFSRQQPLHPIAIDPGTLVAGMIDMLRRSLGEAIDIEFVLGKGLWTATADPSQLENALLNLAINARDAMSGAGTLVIETDNAVLDESYAAKRAGVTAGDYVAMAITDTGTGMSPEVLEHVFEPFFTTKDIGKGTGLGLSMVFGFARQSGGHVAIYSEQGKGTTVKLYLPRTRDKAEPTTAPANRVVPRGRGETVLVVEDDGDVREFTVMLLEGLGYQVLEARDGKSGLAVLEETPGVDLLLSDMVMAGGMSGRDLADEAARRNGDLKVLFMSGYTEAAINLNGWVDKGADTLQKPFRRRDLATKVRGVLDRAVDLSNRA